MTTLSHSLRPRPEVQRAPSARPLLALLALLSSAVIAGCPDTGAAPPNGPSPAPPTRVDPPPAQTTIIAAVRPPPISGGTLLVTKDGARAFAADSDRDRVVEISITGTAPVVSREIPLTAGDEPGRLVEDDAAHVHVVSRGTGAIVSIDRATGSVAGRRYACPAPRGLAFDAATHQLFVACVGGEIVAMPADPKSTAKSTIRTSADLRDVSVQGDRLFVSRFRSAELLVLDREGHVLEGSAPPEMEDAITAQRLAPAVAWRATPLPGGGMLMVHQRAMASVLPQPSGDAPPAYYGPSCWDAIVQPSVTLYDAEGHVFTQPGGGRLANLVLPVDAAITPDGTRIAVVSAASGVVVDAPAATFRASDWCGEGPPIGTRSLVVPGTPVATAYDAAGRLFVQTREPAALWTWEAGQSVGGSIPLGGRSVRDTGHELFHGNPDGIATIACASCHPEGRDDGRVYSFADHGPRRTIPITGGLLETAPFHWEGDLEGMTELMDAIFVKRMGGKPQDATRIGAVSTWIEALPDVPASPEVDHAAAARGKALFEDVEVGCYDCHGGPRFTDAETVDVGTGGKFQVPSLVGLAHGGPYLHDGCAPTLRDRFTDPCGGGDQHGHTSQLDEAQISDLIAYLETL